VFVSGKYSFTYNQQVSRILTVKVGKHQKTFGCFATRGGKGWGNGV
jgi:hypothetical protein